MLTTFFSKNEITTAAKQYMHMNNEVNLSDRKQFEISHNHQAHRKPDGRLEFQQAISAGLHQVLCL
jgi:hypothetical protein